MSICLSQNDLIMNNLILFYKNKDYLDKMLKIINGEAKISLRIVDWFVTNYAKKNYIVYDINDNKERFKVYNDYKLKLKAYSKKRFDPFCRWERISFPYIDNQCIQTTIGQLNFFKWCIENDIIKYIEENFSVIDNDMNNRNSSQKNKNFSISSNSSTDSYDSLSSCISNSNSNSSVNSYENNNKTRKKRQELSVNASKSIKKEYIPVTVSFN